MEPSADVEMRLKIVSAMTAVLASTPFSDIAIKQICSEAHISRPTFYRYFANKEAVPLWHIDHYFKAGSFQIGRTLSWFEGHYVTLSGMAQSALFYQRLELPNGCPPLRQYSTSTHVDNLKETLVTYHGVTLTERLEFQVETFARTRTDITKKWVSNGFMPPPSTFAEFTNSVVPPELYRLLGNPPLRKEYASTH